MHEKQIDPPTRSRLDDAMALLDSRSRHVMELWLEGESHEEIAKVIGLPERAIALIQRSSLWRLRDLIALEAVPEDAEFPPVRAK
jgi:DNA-directed RNA polymerase specialized sigma24 family protein